MKLFWVYILISLSSSLSYAQTIVEEENVLKGTEFLNYNINSVPSSPIYLRSNHAVDGFMLPGFESNYEISNVTNRIVLDLSQNQNNLNFDFTVSVPIEITYIEENSNSDTQSRALSINYNALSGSSFINLKVVMILQLKLQNKTFCFRQD